ncbi:DUF1801 domain-containing protein [Qipengyuania sp. ASV99]|uniref:DUF1801 domain-containing protein n=1 Tax=Qipengyuania sp. ASV99 TaxID=3399681 RepID=UPI003A4C77F0
MKANPVTETKTQVSDASAADFIAKVEPMARRDDARTLLALFERVTGAEARMWGDSIVGFGEYRTTYASGRNVHWMRSGFSPRKAKISLYLMGGYCDEGAGEKRAAALARLGKHKTGASCLYINQLADIDLCVLERMIADDWAAMQRIYPD